MTAPWFIAERRSYETMLETYDREAYVSDNRRTSGGVMRSAVRNGSIPDRIAISHFLLNEGLDPLMIGGGDHINVLHSSFGHGSDRDFAAEAPLLKRLLDLGADMTLRSPRFGTPWEMLVRVPRRGGDATPFYDAIFDRPDLDLDQPLETKYGTTVRDFLYRLPHGLAPLTERARAYDQAHPTPNTLKPTPEDAIHD